MNFGFRESLMKMYHASDAHNAMRYYILYPCLKKLMIYLKKLYQVRYSLWTTQKRHKADLKKLQNNY